jgi:hypothetical protein
MILNLAGLDFKAHSPSDLQLISLRDDVGTGDTVHVRFVNPKWVIEYRQPNGHTVTRPFPSRDAAIDLIASRAST